MKRSGNGRFNLKKCKSTLIKRRLLAIFQTKKRCSMISIYLLNQMHVTTMTFVSLNCEYANKLSDKTKIKFLMKKLKTTEKITCMFTT